MQSDAAFIQHRLRLAMNGGAGEGIGTPITVQWVEQTGGAVDAGTGATVDGEETYYSGVVNGLVHTVPASSSMRQHKEIEAGDLIVDMDDAPQVTTFGSGTVVALADIKSKGVRFILDGVAYAQQEVGEKLATSWDARIGSIRLSTTILLRKAV